MAEDKTQLEAFKAALIAYRDAICEEYWSNSRDSIYPRKSASELAHEKIFELYPKDNEEHPEFNLAIFRIMPLGKFRIGEEGNTRLKDWLISLAFSLDAQFQKR
ncbi:MAG: hypothetical protein NTZ49_02140 [Candidatus Parcubacteria bacterium]|nr:hypothetical protein [Candidatus Parcubacteria bacterium]